MYLVHHFLFAVLHAILIHRITTSYDMSYEETDFVSFTRLNKMVQQMMLHSASIARAKNRSRIYQITQGHNM